MIISRVFGKLSQWTFTIPPIRAFVLRYAGDGRGWAEPFRGKNTIPVEFTNDHNPEREALKHLEAVDFARDFTPASLKGVIFDPPFSYRQISEHYRLLGKKATAKDTSFNFYHRVHKEFAPKVKEGGIVLSFGWNSNGFGKSLGFEPIELLIVNHGAHHNDTLCLAEIKIQ